MPLRHKLGTMSPVVYTKCSLGHVVLLPYTECPTPSSCEYQFPFQQSHCGQPVHREGADSLADIDRLQRKLTEQENEKHGVEMTYDQMKSEEVASRVCSNLYQRLISSATPEMEKDFIREYLKLRPELRGKHHAKFDAYCVYIHAREFDVKGPDEGERKP